MKRIAYALFVLSVAATANAGHRFVVIAGWAARNVRRLHVSTIAVLAVAATSGEAACSTAYQPQHSGRIAVVIHKGAALYVRDGRELPIGPFGAGLPDLVDTAPAAAHANRARTQFMIGVPAYLAGAAGIVVGVAVLSGPVGWAVIGAGAIAGGTGVAFMGSGLTHALDAVNMSNDAVLESCAARPFPVP